MTDGNIIPFDTLDADVQELIRASVAVRQNAYVPYSHYKVGAALRCTDGSIYTGCNVENASYSVVVCAERTAIAKAVSEGKRSIKVITVVADKNADAFTTPCGVCRQMIIEFGDIPIYCSDPEMKTVLQSTAKDLLPHAFRF